MFAVKGLPYLPPGIFQRGEGTHLDFQSDGIATPAGRRQPVAAKSYACCICQKGYCDRRAQFRRSKTDQSPGNPPWFTRWCRPANVGMPGSSIRAHRTGWREILGSLTGGNQAFFSLPKSFVELYPIFPLWHSFLTSILDGHPVESSYWFPRFRSKCRNVLSGYLLFSIMHLLSLWRLVLAADSILNNLHKRG